MDEGLHLIDEYRISYLSTGRDILRFGAASLVQPTIAIVAADPDFDLSTYRSVAADLAIPSRQLRDLGSQSRKFS
jgi:hypothetical protein